MKLPRTASIARTPAFRAPTTSFRRWNSTEGEEKVKGQVIGIDLGMYLAIHHAINPSLIKLF
jgi:hypothetical protein